MVVGRGRLVRRRQALRVLPERPRRRGHRRQRRADDGGGRVLHLVARVLRRLRGHRLRHTRRHRRRRLRPGVRQRGLQVRWRRLQAVRRRGLPDGARRRRVLRARLVLRGCGRAAVLLHELHGVGRRRRHVDDVRLDGGRLQHVLQPRRQLHGDARELRLRRRLQLVPVHVRQQRQQLLQRRVGAREPVGERAGGRDRAQQGGDGAAVVGPQAARRHDGGQRGAHDGLRLPEGGRHGRERRRRPPALLSRRARHGRQPVQPQAGRGVQGGEPAGRPALLLGRHHPRVAALPRGEAGQDAAQRRPVHHPLPAFSQDGGRAVPIHGAHHHEPRQQPVRPALRRRAGRHRVPLQGRRLVHARRVPGRAVQHGLRRAHRPVPVDL
mmetsp:Transcript_17525/g.61589  ORF Transcript_17525/g.61589 Transcript_17525/m.61589 type:complete len:381 (-) Transcript_17525:499-1641(-)